MKKVQHIATINDYNNIAQLKTLHPLVSVIDFSTITRRSNNTHEKPDVQALSFGFYAVFLKEDKNCQIKYGRNYYDYQEGTLVFIAPNQVVSIEEDGDNYQPTGYAVLFHPDLIHGTALGAHIKEYTFFSYDVYEALHISADEKETVLECIKKISLELKQGLDKHSKKLIVANIEMLLNYSTRYYDRQFLTRSHAKGSITQSFEKLLDEYISSGMPQLLGIPSVAYFADKLYLSAGYLGDLIKKETGKTAQELIQHQLVDASKELLLSTSQTVNEIAYNLGFKYPQHFTRFFKKNAGSTPNEYRVGNN